MDSNAIILNDINYILTKTSAEFEKLKNQKILITGGGGFLGFYLVQTIVYWNIINTNSPIELHVYDNFSRGFPNWLKKIKNDNKIYVKRHNVIEKFPNDAPNFDYIIHAASIASPIYYRLNPIETMDANVGGLRNILDYLILQETRGFPIKGFLNFSTSEIYGDPDLKDIPTPEEYRGNVSCTGPRACYDESKRYGETLCVNYFRKYNLPIKIVRPFNNYGPGLKITDRRAIPDFARNIFNNNDIVLLSSGAPTRTFCYVADAIVGYFKTLVIGKSGESYNIGVENPEISIFNLAQMFILISKNLLQYNGKIIYDHSKDSEYLTDNPNRRCPSITKAKNELGYDPQIGIEEGIRRSLIWYSDNLIAEDS